MATNSIPARPDEIFVRLARVTVRLQCGDDEVDHHWEAVAQGEKEGKHAEENSPN